MNNNKQIEKILNRYGTWEVLENIEVKGDGTLRVKKGEGYDSFKNCLKELSTLLTKCEGDAVRGFVDYLNDGEEPLIINEDEVQSYLSEKGIKMANSYYHIFSWEKPIEQILLEWVTSMEEEMGNVAYNGQEEVRDSADCYRKAYKCVREHIEDEIETQKRIAIKQVEVTSEKDKPL
jgi:hypothetical protein